MTRLLTLCIASLLASMMVSTSASAHGSEPLPTDLSAVGDSQWVMRTNFGLITSEAPERYVCEEAFAGGDDFQVGVLGLHEWLVFTHDAVLYSPDGCDFEIRQQIPRKPAGVAVSPERTRAAYLINVDDAAEQGVWWTDDAGQTVEKVSIDAPLHLTRAAFLSESSLVVSAYSTDDAVRGAAHLLLVDLDEGTHRELVELDGLTYPYVFDVHEQGWVVWLGRDGDQMRVYWGPITNPTAHARAVDSWPSGAVLTDRGLKVWVSGVFEDARGVLVGEQGVDPLWSETLVDHSAMCVAYVDGAHHLCARRDREGHDLSRVGADDSLAAAVEFTRLAGPRNDCPADSDVAQTCPAVWLELADALGVEVDSGGGDAGGEADAGASDSPGGDGGCSTGGSGGPVGVWWLIGGVWGLWRTRRLGF
ncbi:hypothetical protein FIV42_11025 [Persicimonas caeni]|uniref:WD40 repeat domain-containing protein n=1 Tax=Persicimonas caeni TaxID=2292766 RepID=A0A4Y6PSP1_PERCE|nr:hypothetical protein [Persicimonas caeni]QDG51253.1 hypothetical protein FIV42_11025 [Persicimonas caeni]QED32474.1 hypothetical protein FRD00_11020 [Persicimonas caeni]